MRLERHHPWGALLFSALAVSRLDFLWLLRAAWRDDFTGKVVDACAIIVAYLVTASTILPALDERAAIRKFREWGRYGEIIDYLKSAIRSSGLLLGLSIAASPIGSHWKDNRILDGTFSIAWWAILSYAVFSVIRAIRTLLNLLLAR